MSDCPSFESLCAGEADPIHLRNCPACEDVLRDVTALRGEARSLGHEAWGAPAQLSELEVERALSSVLGRARPAPRRGTRLLRLSSRAAAALLIAGLGAPYVLETRKDREQPQARPSPAALVFWTTPMVTARK